MKNINIKLTVTNGFDDSYSNYYVLTVPEKVEMSEVKEFITNFKKENEDYTADDIMPVMAEHFNGSYYDFIVDVDETI